MNTGTSPITVAGVTIQPANVATVAGNRHLRIQRRRGAGHQRAISPIRMGSRWIARETSTSRIWKPSAFALSATAPESSAPSRAPAFMAITAITSRPRPPKYRIPGLWRSTARGNVYFADEPNQRIREIVANTGSFTSRANTAFTVGTAVTFAVTTNNAPLPVLTVTGTLPNGISFVDNRNGTGTLGGTPAAGSEGAYNLTFTASNGVFPNTAQNFTLTIYAAGKRSRHQRRGVRFPGHHDAGKLGKRLRRRRILPDGRGSAASGICFCSGSEPVELHLGDQSRRSKSSANTRHLGNHRGHVVQSR